MSSTNKSRIRRIAIEVTSKNNIHDPRASQKGSKIIQEGITLLGQRNINRAKEDPTSTNKNFNASNEATSNPRLQKPRELVRNRRKMISNKKGSTRVLFISNVVATILGFSSKGTREKGKALSSTLRKGSLILQFSKPSFLKGQNLGKKTTNKRKVAK